MSTAANGFSSRSLYGEYAVYEGESLSGQNRVQSLNGGDVSNSISHPYEFGSLNQDEPNASLRNSHDGEPEFSSRRKLSGSEILGDENGFRQGLGQLAQKLDKRIPKPAREPNKPPKWSDVIRYVSCVNRNRQFIKAVADFVDVIELCKFCSGLQLTTSSFLVDNGTSTDDASDSSKFSPGSGTGKSYVGDQYTIVSRARSCSLCRLIIRCLREQRRFEWLDPDTFSEANLSAERAAELRNTKCFLSWQTDGRTLNIGSAGRKSNNFFSERSVYQPRTRRIRVDWKQSAARTRHEVIDPYYIVLVADGSRQSWREFLGQRVALRQSSTALVKSWLDRCSEHHRDSCDTYLSADAGKFSNHAYFGVIDLQDMRLTTLPDGQRYVALSYTWGGIDFYRTKKSNIRSLQAQGAIGRILNMLPQTIKDAMNLARDLGERYFWVDTICIVQDSEVAWQLNANVMNQIYNNAYFTICAADGQNAEAGLANYRVREQSRFHQMDLARLNELRPSTSQKIQRYSREVQLMALYSAESYINKSAWNKRAWTFQERLLSRRCVLFADGQVFFQCRSTVFREDIIAQTSDGRSLEYRRTPLELLGDIEKRPLSVYIQCVELYTRRRLTKSKDILNAFKGVGNYIGKVLGGEGFLYGLPRSHFDWALLWQLKGSPNSTPSFRGKQYEDNGRIDDLPHDFPTWSWCGWCGDHAQYSAYMIDGTMSNVCDWLTNHTWIVWYVRDGRGNLKLVQGSDRCHSEAPDRLPKKWAGYNCKPASPNGSQLDPYGRPLDGKLRRGQPDKFTLTLHEFPFQVNVSQQAEGLEFSGNEDLNLSDMCFLQFFSFSAYFSLKRLGDLLDEDASVTDLHANERRWGIIDYKGDILGIVTPDRVSWQHENGLSTNLSRGKHQFIAISEAKEFSREELHGWEEYVSHETEGTEWDIYYVLLVTEIDDICYRLGLGKVYKEAFSHSSNGEAKWREFILA